MRKLSVCNTHMASMLVTNLASAGEVRREWICALKITPHSVCCVQSSRRSLMISHVIRVVPAHAHIQRDLIESTALESATSERSRRARHCANSSYPLGAAAGNF